MRYILYGGTLLALLAMTPARAQASQLEVHTAGSASQTITMCPNCSASSACAQPGEYKLDLTVDLQQPSLGVARLAVRVRTASGVPVDDAGVLVTLTTPEQGQPMMPLTAKHEGLGEYSVTMHRMRAPGVWTAEVAMTTAKGDTVHQRYTFRKPRNFWVICQTPSGMASSQ